MAPSRFRVLVCDPLHPEAIAWLEAQPDVALVVRPGISQDELREIIEDYDALIVRSRTPIGAEELARARRLRVIGRAGSGLDNIRLDDARRAGVGVVNAPGANADAVAELTVGLMIALARDLPRAFAAREKPRDYGWELRGRRLGIIGVGRIGGRVARLARAFGMRLLAYDTQETPALEEHAIERVSWERLLGDSDLVTLHVPLTEETRRLINAETLGSMREGAALINTARAGVVDEGAVLAALDAGRISGYAADFCRDERVRAHPRVIITPHIGAHTQEAQRRVGQEIAERVVVALRGIKRQESTSRTAFG